MGISFSQTAEHCIHRIVSADSFGNLPSVIHQHTDWCYSCEQTEGGFFLKPSFRNMPYRNAFVPEIDVVITQNNGQTFLKMMGRPVKTVRIFMLFWFGFFSVMELLLLASGLSDLFSVFIPVIMCAFGYFLCKIVTKRTYQAIVKAIQKEYL